MRTTLSYTRRVLSLSVAAALSAPLAAAAAPPIVADGTAITIGNDTIDGEAGAYQGHAMQALNGGSINASGMTLITTGAEAHAAYASGAGSVINLDNSTISTSGYVGAGLVAAEGGQINAEGVQFTSSGNNGRGIAASNTGSTVNFNGGSITTNAAQFADGVRATNGGTVNIGRDSGGNGTTITVAGGAWGGIVGGGDTGSGTLNIDGATVRGLSGLLAQGSNAALNVTDSTIEARNVAIYADAGSQARLQGATIRSGRNGRDGGTGVKVENGAHVDVIDSSISTIGNLSHGIHALTGGEADVRGTTIATSGDADAHGIFAESNGSVIVTDSSVVTSGGGRAHALAASEGGSIQADNVKIHTQGQWSRGVDARNLGIVEISNSDVMTEGLAAHGLMADAGGSIVANNVHIRTLGSAAQGVLAMNGNIVFNGGSVTNEGIQTHGLQASSAGILTADGTSVHMVGAGSSAVYVESNGTFDGNNLQLLAEGDSGKGVFMNGPAAAPLSLRNSTVTVTGEDATGIDIRSGKGTFENVTVDASGLASNAINVAGLDSSAELRNSSILASGNDGHAARVQDGASLHIKASVLKSEGASALVLDASTLTATDGTAIEGNGTLAEFGSDTANIVMFDRDVVALGDIRFAAGATDADGNGTLDRTSTLSLDNNSYWKGATDAVGDLALANGSRWDVTGNSIVGSLSLVGSSVVFDHADGQYKTLTVDGDFHADNGLLAMNTALGDDASPTDLLHVKGDTSGNAQIAVNNIGGSGAQTEDGIKLVQVDGVSAGEYALAGRAVGGAYEYFLYEGGHSNPNDGDWYLRSELSSVDPEVDPCDGNDCTIDPPVKPVPVFRPEAGAYLANQASAVAMFNMDLHERVGEPNLAQRQRGDGDLGAAWARVISEQPRYSVNDQLVGHGRQNVVQIGSDVTSWGKQDRGVFGVMAASGQATSRVTSSLTGYGAEGRVDGRALGVYSTWIQDAEDDDGLYIDGWLQAAQFKNRVQGDALTPEHYRSRSLSASVEAGYALRLHQNESSALYLEPQVQAIWTDYRMDGDQHQEVNGTVVKAAEAGGLQTRVGARLYGHSTAPIGNRVQPFVGVNWIRNGNDANAVWLGEQRLQGIVPKNVYEAKAGAQLQLSRNLTGWGELNVQQGDYGFRSVGGQLGVKYAW
ncbi:autotransporter outer membrane beta-barrel domain-containing protein [Stenotrophomonas maltophilia]|jgi:autotransporter family porin|uniref:autotransporter outer membrane beta-barrel domain-containing protein n=1 Tax=Stenotrophomonas maltophilia TaxID=40324 RepID=UPI0021CA91DE|nr:autotransporter outer membrane beta-barrel domain-containing protein [Stenotrophomonas maltophilia]MCU1110797.1 autotransporter outer membrane beta-barrel domain-containing protein [Stenotrophomonas maltophilia]